MPSVSAEPSAPARPQVAAPGSHTPSGLTEGWAFFFFIASGFCGLVYQVVWLRMIMARFGVNAPVASIVLSTFMLGLGVGSWLGGRLTRSGARRRIGPLSLYGGAELVIATSAALVPVLVALGHRLLNAAAVGWSSGGYFLLTGLWIALALLPWCVCMGMTFPLMMAALKRGGIGETRTSFSYLYLANVAGAALGTLASAYVLIELLGLRVVLWVAAIVNLAIATAALRLARRDRVHMATSAGEAEVASRTALSAPTARGAMLWLLFVTGTTSMALEVVWLRLFIPYLGTVVYSFASVLAIYLVASTLGTLAYRRSTAAGGSRVPPRILWLALALAAVAPLLAGDPRLVLPAAVRVLLGVVPFCFIVGYITPSLVDDWSGGDPARAGSAYAVNVLGSIVGPLLAGFVLLPTLGEPGAIALLAVPILAISLALSVARGGTGDAAPRPAALLTAGTVLAGIAAIVLLSRTIEDAAPAPKRVMRDYEATSIAADTGMMRQLLINGVGITKLTPITKMMAHLPLAQLGRPPENALIVAFGMGTTFRSALSWGIPTTAVDLVPSVPRLFGFFHEDADSLMALPHARVVVDDGRRFLERSDERFDVVIIDPPPPAEAVGSSLLYSADFYRLLRERLRPGGILQQWYPDTIDPAVQSSVLRAVQESFPHVRVHGSLEGWGLHILASNDRIPEMTAAELAASLPPAAVTDLLEWGPHDDPATQFATVLERTADLRAVIGADPAPVLRDDRPVNEYYFVRRNLPALWEWWRAHWPMDAE